MKRYLLGLLAISFLAGACQAQTVVYDNTTTYSRTGMPWLTDQRTDSAEMGDEVLLGNSPRNVVEIKLRLWYTGTVPGTFDARIRLRALDPSKPMPGPAIVRNGAIVSYELTPSPGAIIYESEIVRKLPITGGMNEYTFKIPSVKVPDRFVWTIQGFDKQGMVGTFGPAYYDPPTVGSSRDFFWQSEMGTRWIPYSWGGFPVCNFGCRIIAEGIPQKNGPVVPPLP